MNCIGSMSGKSVCTVRSTTPCVGVLDKKQRHTTMDKMIRFSRALNPKHWRHSKAEPEPLPHPSAMGLMALAARPKDDVLNEYHHTRLDAPSSHTETGQDGSSSEDENFYEDVEIGPIRASTMVVPAPRQTGPFAGPAHRSLPPRMSTARSSDPRTRGESSSQAAASSEMAEERTSRINSNTETHTYDTPSPYVKTKNWASNFGINKGDRLNTKHKYDVPKSNMVKEETGQIAKSTSVSTSANKEPPKKRPPLPPPKVSNKANETTENRSTESAPVPPSRRRDRKPSSWMNNPTTDQGEQEKLPAPSISKSISLNDSISSSSDSFSQLPKPRPRGLKKPGSLEEPPSPILHSKVPKSRSADIVKNMEALSVDSHHSSVNLEPSSSFVANNNNNRPPKPPPKPKVSTHTTV